MKSYENISILYGNGVSGINIEDSVFETERKILNKKEFSGTIKRIKDYIIQNKLDLFLNVRTDYYILGLDNPLKETIERVQAYEQAGADGIFIPCITSEIDIKKIVGTTSLPINVMTMPNLPSFSKLENLGVKRISMAPLFIITL